MVVEGCSLRLFRIIFFVIVFQCLNSKKKSVLKQTRFCFFKRAFWLYLTNGMRLRAFRCFFRRNK